MSNHDPDRDADMTADWPTDQPVPPPADDDGGPTIAAPRHTPPAPPPTYPPPPQYGYGQHAAPGWPPQPPAAAGGGWQPPQPPPGYYAGAGYPGGAPTPPPAKKKPWRLMAGALLLVVILIGAGVFVFGDGATFGSDTEADEADSPATSSQTASPSEAPGTSGSGSATPSPSQSPPAGPATIDPAALPTLLESIPALNEKYKANLIPAADHLATKPFSGLTVKPGTCAGALLPGIDYVYGYANYAGFSGQIVTDEATRTKVMQAVISFDSEARATRAFNMNFTPWKDCAGTTVTAEGGGTQAINMGSVAETDGIATISMWRVDEPVGGADSLSCERAMTPRKNVIVDVRVCVKRDAKSLGENLAKTISQRVADTH